MPINLASCGARIPGAGCSRQGYGLVVGNSGATTSEGSLWDSESTSPLLSSQPYEKSSQHRCAFPVGTC